MITVLTCSFALICRITPAPLDLCFVEGFDGINDTSLCPAERNALRAFYLSAKGGEWTNSDFWLDAYKSHCDWYGVKCGKGAEANFTDELNLQSNGLSGTLSKDLSLLRSISRLDLGDNDLKVRV